MKLSTIKKLIFQKNIFGFLKLSSTINTMYRTNFVVAAGRCGLTEKLSKEPLSIDEVYAQLAIDDTGKIAFKAWLDCGVKIGEIALNNGVYSLKGKLIKHLAKEKNDIAGALFDEVVLYHCDALLNAPQKISKRQQYTLNDQDPNLIARSSQILEPFVEEAIDKVVLGNKNINTVLEVGCGAGYYIQYLKNINPDFKIHAVDYQDKVIKQAERNINELGISNNVEFSCCDVMAINENRKFDLITLHNNIYYFSNDQRENLLNKLMRLLNPGGTVLLTTSCQGGSPAISALNLWFTLSNLNSSLPDLENLVNTIKRVGYISVEAKQLMPGESYYSIVFRKNSTPNIKTNTTSKQKPKRHEKQPALETH